MSRHFICTAGTSILGGAARDASLEPGDLDRIIRERVEDLRTDAEFLKILSAETNSLQAFEANDRDIVTLLVTETDSGMTCAARLTDVISEFLGCRTAFVVIKGLQVEDEVRFSRQGISNLYEAIGDLRRRHPGETILNVTGGFKSVVPYMTLYGILNGLNVAYLFERSDRLIHLPPAPLGVDYQRALGLERFLARLVREELLPISEFEKALQDVPYQDRDWQRSLVCLEEGMVYLSAFGHMVMEKATEETLPVLLSSHAAKTLDKATGGSATALHSLLCKISEPLWRDSHIDPGWSAIDLIVSKPGNVAWRAAYYLDGGNVHICELYRGHNEYTRHLSTRSRLDYPGADFHPYSPPAETMQGCAEEIDTLGLLADAEAGYEETKARLDASEARWVEQDDRIQQLEETLKIKEESLSTSRTECDRSRAAVEACGRSLAGRIRFLFTGKIHQKED